MIVCHCNRITSGDIADAVCCLMSNCAHPELCPENVYEELGACARCCGCFSLATKVIDESRVAFISRAELASLRDEAPGKDEMPPPVLGPDTRGELSDRAQRRSA